jgi:CRISPR-associated protein Cas2
MNHSDRQNRLIVYDIRDDRRLGRIFRYLKGLAVPLQYSVFLQVAASRQDQQSVEVQLMELLDKEVDDIRIYPLPCDCKAIRLGRAFAGPGLQVKDKWLRDFLAGSGLVEGGWSQE